MRRGDAQAGAARVCAILDNLRTRRTPNALLWTPAHPRWELVFRPPHAADLNPIEPWWKVLRPLALEGRRFGSWEALSQAVAAATDDGNARRHPSPGAAATAAGPPASPALLASPWRRAPAGWAT